MPSKSPDHDESSSAAASPSTDGTPGRPTIVWTLTDEAPALATRSFLPVVDAFTDAAGVHVETRDISLAGRVLAQFADVLPAEQSRPDALAELGEMTGRREANIIKLPNISASVPQLKACVAELQEHGFELPEFPDEPGTDEERDARARYGRALGSAVNPVLRQGNSDRRAPAAVKSYARSHPHSMGEWSRDSKTSVATMGDGDFRSTETSTTIATGGSAVVRLVGDDGETTELAGAVDLADGEVVDAAVMRWAELTGFLAAQVQAARSRDVLFSVHLKATMMKVSDPIIFGHAVRAYYARLFDEHADTLERLGVGASSGMAAITAAVEAASPEELPDDERASVTEAIDAAYRDGPRIAMVDSDRGITNLHVPSDVIVDASMPAMIRSGGKMWNRDDETEDALAVIPDSSYAGVYSVVVDDCRENGAYDPTTMGSVPNVGLMAQKAEEYGSHDTTFEIERPGRVEVALGDDVLLSSDVHAGDIWRLCRVKDGPVRDWVRLAVTRARATGAPAVFWLDADRPHDAQLIAKVERYLEEEDTEGLDIRTLSPVEATRFSVERIRRGEDTISVTGNVLRDYLTDLFPILEVGTSAKMLSVVPLMSGGGLFETGAGGSAPKHVQQLVRENHLRWDSLGEFLALAVSLEHLADTFDNDAARVLSSTLDRATATLLEQGQSPSRTVGELDNRGTHFYLALHWARELAQQTDDPRVAEALAPVAQRLEESEDTILSELAEVQGEPVDIGGYYQPDEDRVVAVMRPSKTFNEALDLLRR